MNVSGWKYCRLLIDKSIYCKLNNPLNTPVPRCCKLLKLKSRCSRKFIHSNVPGIISLTLLPDINSFFNFVSPLNAPNSIFLSPQCSTSNNSSSDNEINLSFPNNVILLKGTLSTRTPVILITGTAVNDSLEHLMSYPAGSHLHSSGHSIATLAGTITNHNHKATTGVANSRDTNTTVRFDGMASCCNLQREKKRVELIRNVTVFVVRVWGGQYREELILNITVLVVRVWGGQYRDVMEGCYKLRY